ncbi:MAG TPA: hypothetical protein EYH06_14305 [Chromatiales bacterium]|nr:hypothetical protein [Thiotrichales bacterium]HIP69739.1 hypothetical protein [Chromatiales bacterium]
MTSNAEQLLAGKGRSRLVMIIGALFAALAAAGLIGMGSHFLIVITHVLDGSIAYSRNFAIYNALWIIFFISFLIAGISLIISGVRRKLHDLVPGISLYLAGASLIVIGFYLFIYDELIYAAVAMLVGLTLMIVEWFSKTI